MIDKFIIQEHLSLIWKRFNLYDNFEKVFFSTNFMLDQEVNIFFPSVNEHDDTSWNS